MKTPVKTSMYCRWAHSYNIYFIPAPVHWTKMSLIKWCVWLQYGGKDNGCSLKWMQHSKESKPWTGVHPVWYKILPDCSIFLFCTVRVGYTQFTRLTKNNYPTYNKNPKMAVGQKLYPHCLWPGVHPPSLYRMWISTLSWEDSNAHGGRGFPFGWHHWWGNLP